MGTDRRILSVAAFVLMVVGILAPFAPGLLGARGPENVVIAFTILALSLAVIFGIWGRRFLLGRVAIGMSIIAVIGGASLAVVTRYRFNQQREALTREMVREQIRMKQPQIKERQMRETQDGKPN